MSKQISEAKLQANRENAQHSTGPVTEEGKRISSHNALKTGLIGQTVLLPTDDVAKYETHVASVEARYQPKTGEERLHTQTIAHIEWRLLRIPTLETGLLAIGRKRFAHLHTDEAAESRAAMIEAEVLLEFAKPLANLALQETRLNRQHEREVAKLKALLTARHKIEDDHLRQIALLYMECKKDGDTFHYNDLRRFGFEFSMDDIFRRVALIQTQREREPWPAVNVHYKFSALKRAA